MWTVRCRATVAIGCCVWRKRENPRAHNHRPATQSRSTEGPSNPDESNRSKVCGMPNGNGQSPARAQPSPLWQKPLWPKGDVCGASRQSSALLGLRQTQLDLNWQSEEESRKRLLWSHRRHQMRCAGLQNWCVSVIWGVSRSGQVASLLPVGQTETVFGPRGENREPRGWAQPVVRFVVAFFPPRARSRASNVVRMDDRRLSKGNVPNQTGQSIRTVSEPARASLSQSSKGGREPRCRCACPRKPEPHTPRPDQAGSAASVSVQRFLPQRISSGSILARIRPV